MPSLKKMPVLKVIGIVWIAFASLYVLYGEYGRLRVLVAQRAYNTGLRDAVNQLIEQSKTCQPIPVKSADQQVDLIAVSCLKQDPAASESEE